MTNRCTARLARRPRLLAGGVLAFLALAAPSAAWAEPSLPAQHQVTASAFLTELPAAGPTPATVCIVDSGVTPNRDLDDALVGRQATSGGSPDDTLGHGTLVAMTAVAQRNSWGAVGAWPAGRLLSVRALRDGWNVFAGGEIAQGIDRCLRAKQRGEANVQVISVSIGGPNQPDRIDVDAVGRARDMDVSLVAAGGNSGGPVASPGNTPGVLAVGAGQADGALCPFASRGPELDLVALGCGVELADPATGAPTEVAGSSFSAPFVAASLAALRDHRPDLSVDQAEQLLTSSARPLAGGRMLDTAAAFRAAGLGALVDEHTPKPPPTADTTSDTDQADDPAAPVAPGSEPASSTPPSSVPLGAPARDRGDALQACRRAPSSHRKWCVQPALAWAERLSKKKLRLALVRVPTGARVLIRVNGRLVSRARSRKITVPVGPRSYDTLSVQFSRGAKRSISLTVGRSQLEQ